MISTKEYVVRRRRHTASLLDRLISPKHRLLQQLSPGAKSGLFDSYQDASQHVHFFRRSLLCGVGYHTVTVGWSIKPQYYHLGYHKSVFGHMRQALAGLERPATAQAAALQLFVPCAFSRQYFVCQHTPDSADVWLCLDHDEQWNR